MTEKQDWYRNGDVVIKRVDEIPKTAKKRKKDPRGVVLAEGEATGHCHTMDPLTVDIFDDEAGPFIEVKKETDVTHQTHHPRTIAPGTYHVGPTKEQDPFEQEIRNVAD